MKILIAGDFVISREYSLSNIDQEISDLFRKSDYNIVNLEAPVTESESKILKTGPHLKSERQSTKRVLDELKIDLVTLANNHVLDYGGKGVLDTLEFCSENNLTYVGAGTNKVEASKILFIQSSAGKIAIINITENEWASAAEKSPGANGMDLIDIVNQMNEAKKNSDFVFIIVHGGHEYYNLPSPRIQKQYRFYAELGADLVVGHHTHCISGNEYYNGVPIFYSLGNFLFTKPSHYKMWYIGLVLQVEIKNGKISTRLHPVKQEKENFKLSLLTGIEKQNVLDCVNKYNEIIKDSEKINRSWNTYVESKYRSYLNYWSPISFIQSRYLKAIFIKLGFRFLNKKSIALKMNLLRCETHFDMSKEVINKYLNK